jgi:hypothetical protein
MLCIYASYLYYLRLNATQDSVRRILKQKENECMLVCVHTMMVHAVARFGTYSGDGAKRSYQQQMMITFLPDLP